MVVLTLHGAIPTNTPAFQSYALQVMFTNAQVLASKWHLDENLIATNRITRFDATPYPEGFTASIIFEDRYIFGTERSGCLGFTDKTYYQAWAFSFTAHAGMQSTNDDDNANAYEAWWKANEADLKRHKAVAQQWSRATNHLTLRKARQLAESAMVSVGVPMKKMGFKRPTVGKQWNWADDYTRAIRSSSDPPITKRGTVYVVPLTGGRMAVAYPSDHPTNYILPYYEFRWEAPKGVCNVDVSGITSNIVHFSFYGPHSDLPKPTNQLDLLGLPSSTVFVKRRFASSYEVYEPDR